SKGVKKVGVPAKRFRKPNALKHGAYSSIGLLPWENPEDFEQLRHDLWGELQPEGPLQEECAETILFNRWRKMRLRMKRKLEAAVALQNVEYRVFKEEPPPFFDTSLDRLAYQLSKPFAERLGPARDDYEHLLRFSASFYGDKESPLLELKINLLPEE